MAASMLNRCMSLSSGLIKRVSLTATRGIHRPAALMGLNEDFQAAKDRSTTLKEDPGNMVKLQMYAWFKQATVGKCNAPKPGMMDFVGKAKWDAWNGLGEMTQDEAKKMYVDCINGLLEKETPATSAGEATQAGKYETLLTSQEGGWYKITLNRPDKKNALNYTMYEEIGQALREAAADDSVVLASMTGAGNFYCSGNDLSNFANVAPADIADMAKKGGEILERYVNSYIDFPKPLIGLINGPAVGVSVTILGVFDAVYASDRATFHTPFSALGQSPEGCSSYTFPRIMGVAKATEMLLFNKKITAGEAFQSNLITEVIPDHEFQSVTEAKMRQYSKLPKLSLQKSRNLTRDQEIATLKAVNKQECDVLVERWQSEECMTAIMNFFQSKGSKL